MKTNRLSQPIKAFAQFCICATVILISSGVKAQVSVIQNAIDKLEGYKNFSYQSVRKEKEVFNDTLIIDLTFKCLRQPQDKAIGYLFRNDYTNSDMKTPFVEIYNGEKLIVFNTADSIYVTKTSQAMAFSYSSVLGKLNWIKTFLTKHPSKITKLADTTFNFINSYHLLINVRDTIINHDHIYLYRHLFFNKATGLPVADIIRSRTADFGKVNNYYTADSYSNYKTDQDGITAATFAMPTGLHLPKEQPAEEIALLAPGTVAPNWTLYDTEDKKTSLAEFKGKIVLLDFFFVGCVPCMQTLEPLEKLQEKYKDKNLVILSISNRDSKEKVIVFKNSQRIKNKMYPNGGEVAKLYHMNAGPTFYFIDKNGIIASSFEGSYDFEQKATSTIDALLSK